MKIVIKAFLFPVVGALFLAGCSVAPAGVDVHDPYESNNRGIHAFNKGLDQSLIRPVARGYGAVVPDPIEHGVSNFASNLGLPGKMLNSTLQGNLKGAGQNLLRFVINTTAGVGGLFDPSTVMGLEEVDTGFGETLHTWGVAEGAYLELPVFGPSTERDAAGLVVDMVLDPVSYLLGSPESSYRSGARAGELLQTRNSLSGQLDSLYDESADSYTQLQLIYLQNRRFKLGVETGGGVDDIYDDPYLDPYE